MLVDSGCSVRNALLSLVAVHPTSYIARRAWASIFRCASRTCRLMLAFTVLVLLPLAPRALERDREDPAVIRKLLASAIECSSSPNHTAADLDARSLVIHANAERALWDGDVAAALRHTCSVVMNGTAPRSSRTVCLGHSLAATRSPGGRPYARMVVMATRALRRRNVGRLSARWGPWEALLATGRAHSPPAPGHLVGHVGDGSRPLHSVFRVEKFLAAAECALLLDAAEALGTWTLASHTPYPTADIHLSDLAMAVEDEAMQRWVGMWIASRLYPLLAELYAVEPGSLWLKEAVLIKYLPATSTGSDDPPTGGNSDHGTRMLVPAGVAKHRDASVFSFNVLLNDASELAEGGGTLFPQLRPARLEKAPKASAVGASAAGTSASGIAEDPRLVPLARGDAVVHAGKALHAGMPLQSVGSKRYLLAGFVQLCGSCDL